jgi:hypothetical protein
MRKALDKSGVLQDDPFGEAVFPKLGGSAKFAGFDFVDQGSFRHRAAPIIARRIKPFGGAGALDHACGGRGFP